MKYENLNLSQKEIAMSETASVGENAVNTISVKIHLHTVSPIEAKSAVDRVLSGADVFMAKLNRDKESWSLGYSDKPCSLGYILDEKSKDEATAYMTASDRLPMNTESELYRAEIIPVSEGGCIVYIRFHHLIIDGYGMSLFAQGVLDVLGGKEFRADPFAQNYETDISDSDATFWQNYFDEAEFEPAIFSEKAVGTGFSAHDFSLDKYISDS